ncbi:MAG: VirB4 family type IV secretion/conjugal transfer ATPase, partial [Rickettsiales bacterium]|nr:VirB4 family type IV secretion/conjugal transfer ATPase [Rickettsiales bacterium]
RAIEARGSDGSSRFAGMVSIREYPPKTNAGILDALLRMPFEFIISQSFVFANKQDSIQSIALKQRRMTSGGDRGVSQANELTDAMDLAMGGHIAFGLHHLSLLCITDTLKELEDNISAAYGELINSGMVPVRETINLQAAYWTQLPANFSYNARQSTINTFNLASFASLHNYPVGQRDNNHWGPAVTVLDTTSGTPYFFNFHVRDVGHTTIIGPTGAGKTVLMNFLCAQAQKFNCRMFFFDKDRGAELFIRAIGGVYTILEPGRVSGFNPLQLDDTPENRGFLAEWLRTLVKAQDPNFDSDWMDTIYEAVSGNFKLPKEERYLTNIIPFLGLEGPGTLAGRMGIWHGKESHASMFDNKIDTIDFSKAKIFGFEMGEILKDGLSLGPVLMYLFHRISMSLDGTPTMIVLDEAWALIDNEVFAPKIKDWLKVLRKLNAMVVFATQSVEDASSSAISDTLIQQTATQIFLANPKATDAYRDAFMVSNREFALIKSIDPSTRYFLLKQGSEVVVARVDLSGMDDVINILSGRAETVKILDEVMAEVGDDPNDWMPIFQKRIKEMRD